MRILSDFYKSIFGCKVYKISLNASCTCPNRDGTKGIGGCIFCSAKGSGDFISSSKSISCQFEEGLKLVENKSRGRKGKNTVLYIPYFQSFTSTYGDENLLKQKYIEAINQKDVCGLAIATRPDCISEKILSILKEISQIILPATGKKPFIQLELGLQTSNENTGKLINRCYTDEDYKNAVSLIKKELTDCHIVTHLILGLPGETEKDMIDSVSFVAAANTLSGNSSWGIKFTCLYVLKNTVLEKLYREEKFSVLTEDEYFELLNKILPSIPQNAVVHRLTGDPPKKEAVAPLWSFDKKRILNRINKSFFTLF